MDAQSDYSYKYNKSKKREQASPSVRVALMSLEKIIAKRDLHQTLYLQY